MLRFMDTPPSIKDQYRNRNRKQLSPKLAVETDLTQEKKSLNPIECTDALSELVSQSSRPPTRKDFQVNNWITNRHEKAGVPSPSKEGLFQRTGSHILVSHSAPHPKQEECAVTSSMESNEPEARSEQMGLF